MKTALTILPPLLFMCLTIHAQTGIFENQADVGKPKLVRSSAYDKQSQVYRIKGAGYNIWFQRDEFQFAYNKIKGDFILTANFAFEGKGVDAHRKIGWMV